DVQSDDDRGMTQHLRDDLRIGPPTQQQGRRRMAQVVEADRRQSCLLEQRPIPVPEQIGSIQGSSTVLVKTSPRSSQAEQCETLAVAPAPASRVVTQRIY